VNGGRGDWWFASAILSIACLREGPTRYMHDVYILAKTLFGSCDPPLVLIFPMKMSKSTDCTALIVVSGTVTQS